LLTVERHILLNVLSEFVMASCNGDGRLLPKAGTDFALNTGTNIPAVGFGTWKIPPGKAKETIQKALELGYRHFDCALEYGNQEEIGDALHELIESHQISRGDLFITSKLWNTHHKRHGAYDDLSQTLRQLKLHHLDLWLMHWPLSFVCGPRRGDDTTASAKDQNGKVMLDETSIFETWKAMEEMYKDGKARAIGVSNFPLRLLDQLLTVCEVAPAVVQIEHHPYLQQTDIVEFCHRKGIHVTAYSPLGSQSDCCDVDLLKDPVLIDIGKRCGKTAAQVVLQWNLQRHISAVPKSENPDHMRDSLKVFDFELSEEDISKIDRLERGLRFLSPKKLWGIALFPDEQEEVESSQCVNDLFNNVEAR